MKFIGNDIDQLVGVHYLAKKLNKPIAELIKEQRALKYKQRKKKIRMQILNKHQIFE
jgi:hypothetical protein